MWHLQRLLKDHGWRVVMIAGVGLLFAEIVLFGGVKASTSLLFAGLFALWAAATVLVLPGPGPFLTSPRLAIAAVGSLALGAWLLITLAPAPEPWAAPVWARTGGEPVITFDRAATLRELVKLGSMAALFIAGLTIGRQRRQTRFFFRVLAFATIGYAAWAVVTFWIEPELLLGAPKPFHANRLTGSFFSANSAGSLFGALAAMFLVLAGEEAVNQAKRTPEFGSEFGRGPSFTMVLFAFAGVLSLGALLLSGSRFAIAATAGGLAVGAYLITVLAGVRYWIATAVGLVALGGAIMLPFLSNAGAARRVNSIDSTIGDRMGTLNEIIDLSRERLWQGHGFGAFREAVAPTMDADNLWLLWDLGAAHNLGAQWLLEGGLIGAGLGAIVLAALLSTLWPWPLKRLRPGKGRTIAVLAFAVVLLLHNMVDYSLQVPAIASLFALVLGLAAASLLQGEHKGEAA